MRVGIPRETTQGERRVALVPETVSKLTAGGFELVVEQGAGTAASFPDDAYTEAGAVIGDAWGADGVGKGREPSAQELGQLRTGQLLIGVLEPPSDQAPVEELASRGGAGGGGGGGFGARGGAGDPPAAGGGRAFVRGNRGGVQGGASRRGAPAALLPDAHDRRRHGSAREGARDRCRGGRAAGDCHGPSARRRDDRLRRASRRARADREPGSQLARSRRDRGGGRGRLRTRAHPRGDGRTAAGPRGTDRGLRRSHHHRGRPRPAGAEDHPGLRRRGHAAWLRHRRPRLRDRRQLRADRAGRDRAAGGRDPRRADGPSEHDAVSRLDAVLAERPGAPPPPRAGGRAHARLGRRDHERRLRRRQAGRSRSMSHNTLLVFEVTILVLAIFLGIEVISKVPTLLHTPLMSGTNAIHGVVIVGAMIVLGQPDKSAFTWIVGFAAVVLAAANVVGGFVVTDRMLEMFKGRERPKRPDET